MARNKEKSFKPIKINPKTGQPEAPDVIKCHHAKIDMQTGQPKGEIQEYQMRFDGRYGSVSKIKSGAGAFTVIAVGTKHTRGKCSNRRRKRLYRGNLCHTTDKHSLARALRAKENGEAGRDINLQEKRRELLIRIAWCRASAKDREKFVEIGQTMKSRWKPEIWAWYLKEEEQIVASIRGRMNKNRVHELSLTL